MRFMPQALLTKIVAHIDGLFGIVSSVKYVAFDHDNSVNFVIEFFWSLSKLGFLEDALHLMILFTFNLNTFISKPL